MAEPLILLPGMLCDARVWATQQTVLSYGRPVTVATLIEGERIEGMASDLLTALPSKFALCGHGLGGIVALEILRRAPERVLRLGLISTNPLADTPQEAADREPRIIGAKAGRFETILTEEVLPRYASPAARTEVAQMAASLGPAAYARQERAMQRRRDYQPVLSRSTLPVLFVAGARDQIVAAKRQEFAANLTPGGKFQMLQNAGHLPMLDDAAGVTEVLFAWLNQGR